MIPHVLRSEGRSFGGRPLKIGVRRWRKNPGRQLAENYLNSGAVSRTHLVAGVTMAYGVLLMRQNMLLVLLYFAGCQALAGQRRRRKPSSTTLDRLKFSTCEYLSTRLGTLFISLKT
jgi:hypothetical protein